ncbi:hypothetical protein [Enterobacter cancerogenus]|uniref:hypothetical protein n=1 Tax=Enterobacter cancerogenus TaxID=69218 RepID=UPI000733CF25|nr:hypothetical protein [Enterobacter cancerogenus]KTQ46062.1 hypothetical protein NS104_17920 [Enterobacter cancerogenus]KTQ52300.1 hypothetical protein NS111_09950 [Enterobacter cancerogenus]KTQ69868.1 hypothetical protein NS188_19120 [Enterobacter cancerogenus]KTQ79341.1 hypothetical protein NS31R_14970 [Enterobacter cancerogenus]
MKKVLYTSAGVIVSVCALYYFNFGVHGQLSTKTDVWAQFGDYLGGVVNPILSFITIYLLINSIKLQREANLSLINEVKRQELLEEYKKFEVRFFHLIECQDSNFERFNIQVGDTDQLADGVVERFASGEAVTQLEDNIIVLVDAKVKKELITNWLDDVDASDCIFSVVRRFYLIVKLIDGSDVDREDYYEALINLTDIKIISLIAIACTYYDWDIIKYLQSSNILERDGIKEFISQISPHE